MASATWRVYLYVGTNVVIGSGSTFGRLAYGRYIPATLAVDATGLTFTPTAYGQVLGFIGTVVPWSAVVAVRGHGVDAARQLASNNALRSQTAVTLTLARAFAQQHAAPVGANERNRAAGWLMVYQGMSSDEIKAREAAQAAGTIDWDVGFNCMGRGDALLGAIDRWAPGKITS